MKLAYISLLLIFMQISLHAEETKKVDRPDQTRNNRGRDLSCDVNNPVYIGRVAFQLDPAKRSCECKKGVYTCTSICPNENAFPVLSEFKCAQPVLEKVDGKVCGEWKCDKEYDFDVKITNDCEEPNDACIEASSCYKTMKLLHGTERDVRTAQRKFCGTIGKIPSNEETRFAYNPLTNDIGPMVCCSRENYSPVSRYPERCSKDNPYLRTKSCGRTPMFFLNAGSKNYLHFRDEYYNRLKKEGCGKSRNPLTKYVSGKREAKARKKRLAGGYPARIGQFPYLAQIYYADYAHFSRPFFGCIATIIHPRMVLTTAHCTLKGPMAEVWVGQYDPNNITYENINYQWVNEFKYALESTPQSFGIQGTTYMEGALQGRINRTLINPYDVAIVTIKKEMKLNDFVEPVCMLLADSDYKLRPFLKNTLYAVGYGFGSQFKNKALPRFIEVEFTLAKWCEAYYSGYYYERLKLNIRSEVFCVSPRKDWQGPCSMDEGSPLLLLGKDGRMYQIGMMLNQLPETCGFTDRPAMYVSLYAQKHKILHAMKKALNETDDQQEMSKCLTAEERAYNISKLA